MNPESQTAILIFSRTAPAESGRKRLLGNSRSNVELLQKLWMKTHQAATQTSFNVFTLTQKDQSGENFGQRLSGAIEHVFSLGYQRVITIGSDCPELSTEDISKAHALLQEGKAVIGPDKRGGTYLIGLTKAQFDKDEFQNLPWKTDSLAENLGAMLVKAQYEMAMLDTKSDLNNRLDVVLMSRVSCSFRKLFALTFSRCYKIVEATLEQTLVDFTLILRGPPRFILPE